MGPWVWTLLGGTVAAQVSLVQYVLRLRFLWKVYEHGGREDLAVAGKVTVSAIEALRHKCHSNHESSINAWRPGVEQRAQPTLVPPQRQPAID